MRFVAIPSLVLLLVSPFVAVATVRADEGLDWFEKRIRPVLVQHCDECHSGKSKIVQGNLRVDSREGLRAGGDSGPAVVPKKPGESLIVAALKYDGLQMPPKGKLPESVAADFVKWIEMGAPDPRDKPPAGVVAGGAGGAGGARSDMKYATLEAGRTFWSFIPPKRSPVPEVRRRDWPRNEIDRFLLAKLEAAGLSPAPDADPATLLRRVHFDLVGLPPSVAQLDAWLADPSPERFARVVDELLASPRFGERWGRHWLDVARFAETSGGGRSLIFPDAWRYRDYVIRAVNDDTPYDRFLIEQIAGDLLPFDTSAQRENQVVATGFLAIGPTNYERQDKDVLEMDVIDEQLDTIGRAMLGMTIGCARCHDHKFDPIPTRDYYALAGILKSTRTLIHDNVSKWVDVALPMDAELADQVKRHEAAVAALQKRIAEAKALAKAATPAGGTATAAEPAMKGALKPSQLPGLVLDDSQAKRVGPWTHSTFTGNFIGDGYLYDDRAKGGDKTLTFVPEFPADGRYEVRLAYVAHTNRADNVPVTILHLDGEKTVTVDMKAAPPIDGRFVSLGTYRFDRNGQWFVLVSNKDTNGHISVDAVQFLSEKDLEAKKAADAGPAIAEIPPAKSTDGAQGVTAAMPDLKALEAELKKLNDGAPKRPLAMGVNEMEKPGDIRVCVRGSVTNRGDVAPRGFLRVTLPAGEASGATAKDGAADRNDSASSWSIPSNQSGRLQLAQWVAARDNPLTARVMVNRVWQHLFGAGIVRTPDLFGTTGELPSHPELLDWLALEFMAEQGSGVGIRDSGQKVEGAANGAWSVKRMIRLIVLSRAYQLSSDPASVPRLSTLTPRPAEDPDNRLLARQNRRRLEAECLRDTMLVVAGRLDLAAGGPTMKVGSEGEYGYKFDDVRRSVYTPILRNRLHELFEAFDFADPNLVLGRRNVSTVPTQALFLLNSPFVMAEAEHAAKHALSESSPDKSLDEASRDSSRLDRAWRAALSRLPTDEERRAALRFLKAAGSDPARRAAAWSRVFQTLFASVDFRYAK